MTKKTQALAIRRAVEFLLSLEIIHLKNKNKTDAANYKDEGGDEKLLINSMWPYNTIKIYYLSFPLDIGISPMFTVDIVFTGNTWAVVRVSTNRWRRRRFSKSENFVKQNSPYREHQLYIALWQLKAHRMDLKTS